MRQHHWWMGCIVLGGYLWLSLGAAWAITCNEDCHRRCRKCVFGACVVEPTCHLQCEAAKKAACAVRTTIPDIVLPPRPEDIADPRRLICHSSFLPAYETFVHGTAAYCANWEGRSNNMHLIQDAVALLQQAGLFGPAEFQGVDIRWCPLNANGMVPTAGKVLLNPRLQGDRLNLAVTLAHEMIHIRQFRRWPSGEFQCRYGEQLVQGRGQGPSNNVEREAYNFENPARDALLRVLNAATPGPGFPPGPPPGFPPVPPPGVPLPPQGGPIPQPPMAMSGRCITPAGVCFMMAPGPMGAPCWCPTPGGPLQGFLQ